MACNCKKKLEDPRAIEINKNIEKSKADIESIIERISEKIYQLEKELKHKETDSKEYLSFKDVK